MADAYLCRASGGVKIELLWENASPTSAFPAQTVAVSLQDYDFVDIELSADPKGKQYAVTRCDKNCSIWLCTAAFVQGGAVGYSRCVYLKNEGAEFAYGQSTGGAPSDIYAIPIAIYGIKGVR
ncbi:MAG: hypothetical protein RR194_02710 [Ruthenibacterium sp.]